MRQFEYESIPVERRNAYLECAAAAFNEAGEPVELETIGVTAEQMDYVGRHFADSAEYMVNQPSEEWELQAIERHANLGDVTLPEYVIGLICVGELDGSISEPQPSASQPDTWYGI